MNQSDVLVLFSASPKVCTWTDPGNMPNSRPPTKWGQTKDYVFLTISIQDIDKPKIQIEPGKLHFQGQQLNGLNYETALELFDEIVPKASKYSQVSQSHWRFSLKKKDTRQPFWTRLVKTTEKCQWISSDWDHYAEDDGDEEALDGTRGRDWYHIDEMVKQMNGSSSALQKAHHDTNTDSDADSISDLDENAQS